MKNKILIFVYVVLSGILFSSLDTKAISSDPCLENSIYFNVLEGKLYNCKNNSLEVIGYDGKIIGSIRSLNNNAQPVQELWTSDPDNALTITSNNGIHTLNLATQDIFARRVFTVSANPVACNENQIFYNRITNRLLICTATNTLSQIAYIGEGTGITSLNGLLGTTQTFATGTTGTDFSLVSSGTIHTFNLPSASVTNRGLLTSADWTNFNSKQAGLGLATKSGTGTTAIGSTLTALATDDCLKWNGTNWINSATCGAGGGGAVDSVFGRTGVVIAQTADYNFTQIAGNVTDAQVPDTITLSNLNQITTRSASDLTSGTLNDSRFPSTLPIISGANLTNVNAVTGDSATSFFTSGILEPAIGGTGVGAPADDQILVGNGTIYQLKTLPSCSNGATDKLLYDISTNTITCGADQTSGGGSGITTLNTLTATTQTFSKTDDTNVTLTLTPSGSDHNFTIGWAGTLADARVADNITLTNITQITNRALVNTTGDLAVSRIDDGGVAATQALFSGAGAAAGFRAIADADIPNNITIDLATTATTATLGDSATSFFSSGTFSDALLSANVPLLNASSNSFTGNLLVDGHTALGNSAALNTAYWGTVTGSMALVVEDDLSGNVAGISKIRGIYSGIQTTWSDAGNSSQDIQAITGYGKISSASTQNWDGFLQGGFFQAENQGSGSVGTISNVMFSNHSGGGTATEVFGGNIIAYNEGGGIATSQYIVAGVGRVNSGSDTTTLIGFNSSHVIDGAGSTVTTGYGFNSGITVTTSAAVTTWYNYRSRVPTVNTSGTIGTLVGYYSEANNGITGVTTAWQLYFAGAGSQSRIEGSLRVGSFISDAVIPAASLGSGSGGATKFLREDGTWQTVSGSGDMILASVQTVTGAKTFDPAKLIVGNVGTLPTPVLGALAVDTDDTKLYYAKDGITWGEVFVNGLSLVNLTAHVTGVLPIANGGTSFSDTTFSGNTHKLTTTTGTLTSGRCAEWDASGNLIQATDPCGSGGGGSGDVVGPASATDLAIVRFDLTTGKLVQNSVVTIADTTGDISSPGNISLGVGSSVAGNIELGQGTAPSLGTTAVTIYSPTSVTSYALVLPTAAFTGILKGTNSAGVVTLAAAVAGTDYTTSTATETFTNKTFDTNATGNLFTIPKRFFIVAAGCNGTTGTANFDLPTTGAPTASCTGTTTTVGAMDYVDAATTRAFSNFKLPGTWTGAIDINLLWFANSASSNAVRWSVALGCVADSEAVNVGPSYNAASVSNAAYVGTANQRTTTLFNSVAVTNCAVNETMWLSVERIGADGGDTLAATAELLGVEVILRVAE